MLIALNARGSFITIITQLFTDETCIRFVLQKVMQILFKLHNR